MIKYDEYIVIYVYYLNTIIWFWYFKIILQSYHYYFYSCINMCVIYEIRNLQTFKPKPLLLSTDTIVVSRTPLNQVILNLIVVFVLIAI